MQLSNYSHLDTEQPSSKKLQALFRKAIKINSVSQPQSIWGEHSRTQFLQTFFLFSSQRAASLQASKNRGAEQGQSRGTLWDSSGTADVFTFPHPLSGRQSPARGPCHTPFLLPETQPDYKSEMLGYQKTRRFLGDLQRDPRAEELTHRGPGTDRSKLLGAEVQVWKQLAGT